MKFGPKTIEIRVKAFELLTVND